MHSLEKILQAIGEASMCWSETPNSVFDSDRAVQIAKRLYMDLNGYKIEKLLDLNEVWFLGDKKNGTSI